MFLKLAVISSCVVLAGCATAPESSAVATCTDLISSGGGVLKYCQTGNRIDATETGVDPRAEPPAAKTVDDLEVLQGLQKQIGLSPRLAASRRLVARACVVDGVDYLTVSVKDLKRILGTTATAEAPRAPASRRVDVAAPAASGPEPQT